MQKTPLQERKARQGRAKIRQERLLRYTSPPISYPRHQSRCLGRLHRVHAREPATIKASSRLLLLYLEGSRSGNCSSAPSWDSSMEDLGILYSQSWLSTYSAKIPCRCCMEGHVVGGPRLPASRYDILAFLIGPLAERTMQRMRSGRCNLAKPVGRMSYQPRAVPRGRMTRRYKYLTDCLRCVALLFCFSLIQVPFLSFARLIHHGGHTGHQDS